ncbi:hypothetical protein C8A05DRAFT_15727 [Staphylotrichum tortipilum]|uniref:F-box domain-containing protein n=1 Tax=Staphylotrichum tortipilum TaxID=2831512 RepID=A0AAN6MLF2_9PEZI|nr:hypothetical protein C8A05DRAFT_15727 [Staphylotrichum longicolle]
MPSITQLPCEMVAEILGKLDHLRFLLPALLACRHFYTSFKKSHGVKASILRRQITPALLPNAVALVEASRLPRPLAASSVVALLDDLHNRPASLAAWLPTIPTALVQKMGRTHDAIHALATGFATSALDCISPPSAPAGTATEAAALSPLEYFRFCRAFYRVDLFYTLFRGGSFESDMNPWFFSRHSLWENEQLGCVYEYLEARFAKASREVVAHDVLFGEVSVDYLTSGEDNQWRQTWAALLTPERQLSHGVEFVYNLTIADSYDAKHRMLQSALDPSYGRVNLPEALHEVLDDADGRPVQFQSEEELHSIALRRGDSPEEDDTDQGPYKAWRNAHADSTLEESLMFEDDAWLRGRAYVFWDRHRVQQQFKDGFGEEPGYRRDYTEREYADMLESFRERSKIWQKGGKGFWSRGDTSRIVWPDK